MEFRFNAKSVFLTYPKCPLSKEEVLQRLQVHGIKEYIVSCEKHQDGTNHLHLLLIFTKKLDTKNSRFFDIDGHHPNIQRPGTLEDKRRIARYIIKDGDFIQDTTLLKRSREELFKAILEAGEVTASFIRENPSVLGLNFTSIQGWLSLLPRPDPLVGLERPTEKKRHIWLYGPSNTGKTTWLQAYLKGKTVFYIPENNDWRGCNTSVSVCYADEYKGMLTVQVLNRLCDGGCPLNTKGGSTYLGYPTIVIVSNFSIPNCYSNLNCDLLETLYNRFIEFNSAQNLPPL